MLAGQVLVGMQRVAPGVQRVDPQPVPGDGGQPGRPGLAAGEQARHVAVRVRRIATRTDLELGDLGSGYRQPAQDLLEGPVEERLEHHADTQIPDSLRGTRSLSGAVRLALAAGGHTRSASCPGQDHLPIAGSSLRRL